MPFATAADMQPRGIVTRLAPPPTTGTAEREGEPGWSMSYHSYTRPQELFHSISGLGADERHELDRLPKSLVAYLAEEAEDPAFVRDYLIPALQSHNPYKRIVDDITEAVVSHETGMGDLGKSFFKKIAKVARKVTKTVAKTTRAIHAKITPKFMRKIEGKISKVGKKVWTKYGSIIISVAGAILAPFTGGASLAAAAVLVAAKGMYDKKKAAVAAKKAAKADAGILAQEAATQESETSAQVDKFYAENQWWFLQYDITPDKWAKLTLDEKINLINAGAEGKLPAGTSSVSLPPEQVAAQAKQTAQAAAQAGIPQSTFAPPGAGPGVGYDTSAGGAPPPGSPEGGGTFDAIVEGQSIGTFGSADEAFQAILAATTPGDRFEIIANGKTMGLAVRTEEGAVDVPPEAVAKMRAMSKEEAHAIVERAEAETPKSGGFPWLLVLAGGAAAVAAAS